jgi:hypothetical protein
MTFLLKNWKRTNLERENVRKMMYPISESFDVSVSWLPADSLDWIRRKDVGLNVAIVVT